MKTQSGWLSAFAGQTFLLQVRPRTSDIWCKAGFVTIFLSYIKKCLPNIFIMSKDQVRTTLDDCFKPSFCVICGLLCLFWNWISSILLRAPKKRLYKIDDNTLLCFLCFLFIYLSSVHLICCFTVIMYILCYVT